MKVKLEVVIELDEMDVGDLATAIMWEIRAMDINKDRDNPDGEVALVRHLSVVVKDVSASTPARPPTPTGWSDTDWTKHLKEHPHPLAGLHINQGSMDAAADAYEAEYNAAHNYQK